jgi:hypothetical protein
VERSARSGLLRGLSEGERDVEGWEGMIERRAEEKGEVFFGNGDVGGGGCRFRGGSLG